MKYSESNKPLVCMMTQSTCYKGTTTMSPKGVLWHSTGANNPTIKRYVQPDDNASNRAELLKLIGKNNNGNDWNHQKVQAGLNAWIGKLADGTVAAVQTMPWNYKPWGCGSGSKGSCNNGWMQFEICEDSLSNKKYFEAVYKEACELTAYYCKMYNLDPKGTVTYKGVEVPVILDHATSYKLKLGGNHGDIQHWFKKYGKTLDDVREDVAKLMELDSKPVATPVISSSLQRGDKGSAVKKLQENLLKLGYSFGSYGADGSFGATTEKVVKQFQKDNNLTQDGIVGSITQAAIDNALKELSANKSYSETQFVKDIQKVFGAKIDGVAGSETLGKTLTLSRTKNKKHAAVKYVQKRLYALGYTEVGEADGVFGPATEKAVKRFQSIGGGSTDGEITARQKTWKRLLGMSK